MMTASRDSVAYELRETRGQQEQTAERNLREVPTRRRKKSGMRTGLAACAIILAMTVVYMLVCEMRLTALTAEVTKQTSRLDELTAESISLSSRQAYDMDLSEIAAYAVEQLGMVKMDNSQIEYIELVEPDTVSVAESSVSLDALFAGLARSFSAVVEYIN